MKRFLQFFFLFLLLLSGIYFLFLSERYPLYALTHSFATGDSIDAYNGIAVYNNGVDYSKSSGKHYNKDSSFYYGKKWQCVEYIKRYYHDHLLFTMTDGMGHAKDFFDPAVKQGGLNKRRGLLQFKNDDTEKPKVNDILVFGGKYGHVAIVTNVSGNEVEVIQQNIYMQPREKFKLAVKNGICSIGDKRKPNGWLRIP